LSRRFVYQHMIVPGSARAQHPAAGVQYQLETLRSSPVRGRETGTIGKADYILCRASPEHSIPPQASNTNRRPCGPKPYIVKTLSKNKGYFLGFPRGLLACRRLSWLPPCNGRETEEGHFVETAKTLSPASRSRLSQKS